MASDRHGSRLAEPLCPPPDIKAAISHLMPEVGNYWDQPLSDYAHMVYAVEADQNGDRDRATARDLLCTCIVRAARRSGFTREEAGEAGAQMLDHPVLQTGPHCHLAFEPDAFYTHLFAIMGLNAHGRRWHICYNTSTVKFSEAAKKGPGWLRLDGVPINVFGMSRKNADRLSVCGQDGRYRFHLLSNARDLHGNASAARLKTILPHREFASAAEAIESANQLIWRRYFSPTVNLLQFDDIDIADLVAAHLTDPGSWLSQCFIGDPQFAIRVIAAVDAINRSGWNGWIRGTTDFFWGLYQGRIFPLRLSDGMLSAGREDVDIALPFRSQELSDALRRRTIVPNMLTAFLVLSILPGVRVLGGCRQLIYYPLMRAAYAAAIRDTHGKSALLDSMSRDQRPGVWGHRTLRPEVGNPFEDTEQAGSTVLPAMYRFADQSLHQSCGNLASFTADPSWAVLCRNLIGGTVGRHDPQWAWA